MRISHVERQLVGSSLGRVEMDGYAPSPTSLHARTKQADATFPPVPSPRSGNETDPRRGAGRLSAIVSRWASRMWPGLQRARPTHKGRGSLLRPVAECG